MRFCVAACCSVIVFSVLVDHVSCDGIRRKRFLGASDWQVMPESMARMSDLAKELSSSLTSSFQTLFPQASRRQDEVAAPPEKREPPKSSTGDRELESEDDEKAEEVKDPEAEKAAKPTEADKETAVGLPFHIPFSLSFGMFTPWWNGPNVCVERSEVDEPDQEAIEVPGMSFNLESTQCMPSETSYVCTKTIQTNGLKKTIMVRRQCCHGYVRRKDGRPGCTAVKMETLIDTMQNLEMTKFLQLIEANGMTDGVLSENLTVFAPSNDAVVDFEDETEDNEISAINSMRKQTDWYPVVQSHFVDGFVNIDTLENEQVLDTLYTDSKIRINKYEPAHEVVTANCVPISAKNHFATNGMVQQVSSILPFPSKTVGEIIENEPEFSMFRNLLQKHDLLTELKQDGKVWTLFAPTDKAFEAADPKLVKEIENGEGCVQSILKHHIVKGTVCSSAIVGQARVKNQLDNILKLTKDVEENLKVEDVLINSADKIGTNGVLHSIENILVPQEARSLLKTFKDEDRTDILDLIEEANLLSEFGEMDNVTFFMPSETALKKWLNATSDERESNPDMLKQMLLHHVAQPRTPLNKFSHNKSLKASDGQTIDVKLHELFPGIVTGATAQCAYLTSHDNKACGAIVHKINKVLQPARGSIIDAIKDMEEHTIVNKMLNGTEIEKKLQEGGPYTFLAPTDDAFKGIGKDELEEIYKDSSRAEEMLKSHVLPETLCCSDISHPSPFQRQYVRTFGGNLLPLHRSFHERVRFGRSKVVQCDIPANNGLVHSVDRIIIPRRASIFDLWPLA